MPLTQEQHATRRSGIGASEIAAVMGLDPYRTPFDIWYSKTGKAGEKTEADSEAAVMGHLLEPVVATLYGERHPDVALGMSGTLRHLVHPIILATPDRVVYGAQNVLEAVGLVEIKTKSFATFRAFGEPGTDQVPHPIALQVQQQMLVCDLTWADVAVLVDGRTYHEYRVHADGDLQAAIVEAATEFWARYVVTDTPPTLEGPKAAEYVARRWKTHSDELVEAKVEQIPTLLRLRDVRASIKALEAEKQSIEAQVKDWIGPHRGLTSPIGKMTWTATKGTRKTDWEAVAMAAGATPDLIAQHTTTSEGSRRFLPTFKED